MTKISFINPFTGETEEFSSRAKKWASIERFNASSNTVLVDDRQFAASRLVSDVCVGYWDGKTFHQFPDQPVKKQGICIIIESPHKGEYSENNLKGIPVAPLCASRSIFNKNIVKVLSVLKGAGVLVPEGPVNLVNAIQYQASLAALTTCKHLLHGVRSSMWNHLYDRGGESDFMVRIKQNNHKLLILAPTAAVRSRVVRTISRRDFEKTPNVTITPHPSVWSSKPIRIIAKSKGQTTLP